LVYIDPATNNPAGIFVSAKTAQLEGGEIRLDNGSAVGSGVLTDQVESQQMRTVLSRCLRAGMASR
jgi:hypothetical protein